MGIPTDYTWTAVLTSVGDLLSNGMVVSAITAVFAIRFAPRIIGAVLRSTRGR